MSPPVAWLLLTAAAAHRRVQEIGAIDNAPAVQSRGEKCCCNISSHADEEMLSCKPTEAVTTFMLSFCPAGLHYANDYLLPAARESCDVSTALGPVAQQCQGLTAGCDCSNTVDAHVPSSGRAKGRILTPGSAERAVAGFFGLHYATYRGRWEHSTPLMFTSAWINRHEAQDHCSSQIMQQLRTKTEIHGQFCFQWLPALGRFGTESCLTLDVYTPAVVKHPKGSKASPFRLAVDSALPVMVFIEGGGFVVGDKYQQGIYDGRKLARMQNIIVVSVNYRLGVFGFLHHPELRDEAGEPMANFGLRDQVQALRWVQTNIAAFGGDPNRVSVVGESAGAMSICAHLASPTSRGFFKNAILESGNCDGLFIWQPRRYAEDYGMRYVRGVFGRIRGCYLSGKNQTYKDSQNGCSKDDTAPMHLVRDLCKDVFLDPRDLTVTESVFADILPFEHVSGCDADYRGCQADLPSGLDLDKALLQCAQRLPTRFVWVNQFAIIHHQKRSDSSFISRFMGMGWFGAPPPPHLPWAPIVDLDSQGERDFAQGSGMLSLPLHSYDSITQKLQIGTITAGFNRDEGSLFYLLLPNFFSGIDTSHGLQDSDYRLILKSMACPDWGPAACTKPGCVEPAECEERVSAAETAYKWEPKATSLRGQCCSTDPNILRLQRMLTDMLFVCPTFRLLRQMRDKTTATIRSYQFAADDELPHWFPNMRDLLGAFHFSELFFVMGDKDGPGGNLPLSGGALGFGLGWSKQDLKITANMSGSWGALVRDEDLSYWPKWESDEMVRFALDVPSNVDVFPIKSMRTNHHCDFFDDLNDRLIKDVR